jgi:hypothetical protein
MTLPDRARAYLAKLPVAVAGSGGHAAAFRAACALVEFGLSSDEAWPLLMEWNTQCLPPWAEGDLRHKLADAFKRTQPRAEFASRSRPPSSSATWQDPRKRDASRVVNGRPVTPVTGPGTPEPGRSQVKLPPLTEGTPEQHAALSTLRGVSPEAVAVAVQRGLLRFGEHFRKPAWFIVDGERIATARRLDGKEWWEGVKAPFLPGSQARWPVGIEAAKDFPCVALVEGGPDLLAAFHLILAQGRAGDIAPVAMMSAAPLIHLEALPLFRGKRVRLFPHSDDAGLKSCERWAGQLAYAGAVVDAFSLGSLAKDLNELVRTGNVPSSLFPT